MASTEDFYELPEPSIALTEESVKSRVNDDLENILYRKCEKLE